MEYALVKGILMEISVHNVIQDSLMLTVKVLVPKYWIFLSCIYMKMYCSLEMTKILLTTGALNIGELKNSTVLIDLEGKCSVDLPNYPKALKGATGNFANDMIIICGGYISQTNYIKECYKLSKGGKSFDSLHVMSESRGWPSSTVVNDQIIWLTGGKNENGALGTTEFTNSSTIFSGVNLPESINNHVIITMNDTTSLLIGGNTDTAPTEKTYYFNHETNIWITGPNLTVPRASHTAGVIKDHITLMEHVVVAGGGNPITASTLKSVEILFNNENYWSKGEYFFSHIEIEET